MLERVWGVCMDAHQHNNTTHTQAEQKNNITSDKT